MDTVFFDMDGTLIDTEKYYNVCWCEAIAKFGYTITKEEALPMMYRDGAVRKKLLVVDKLHVYDD